MHVLLLFHDVDQETAFKKAHQEMLPRIVQWSVFLGVVLLGVIAVPVYLVEGSRDGTPFNFRVDDPRSLWFLLFFFFKESNFNESFIII